MRNDRYHNSPELSKHVWTVKAESKAHAMKWHMRRRAKAYGATSKRCKLCITEKLSILTADQTKILNKRVEIVAKRHHSAKYRLCNYTSVT